MKAIVSQVAPLVAKITGFCETSDEVYDYINQACRRLLHSGLWSDCYGRFTIYTSDGCITWPRAIETIEGIATCCTVGTVRNQWYEFQGTGLGLLDRNSVCAPDILVDRGTVVAYRDMSGGTNSYLRVYPGDSSDVGRTITLQGYDASGNWIRTDTGSGGWIDGEIVTLALPYAQSTKKFTTLTGVQRQSTNTVSRLYEYNATDLTELDLAVFEPDETLPQYRRSFLSGLCSETEDKPVTVMAKLRHIDVSLPTDYVIPPCPDAIKLMAKAIRAEESDQLAEAIGYETKALDILQKQSLHVLGDAVPTIRMVGADLNGGGVAQYF